MYSETYGYLENSLENYEESIKYFKSGMQFNPKECSMNLANALEQMGSLLFAMKNFQRSKEIFLNSPNLFEEAFGENHIIFVKSLCNASIVLNSLGDYKQAEINLLKAKKIVDKPTEATWSLYNLVHILLSRLYSSIGNRPKIEQILQLIESTILKFNVVDLTHLHLFYLEKSFFLIEFEEFERCFDTVKKCMDINQKIYCNVRKNNTFPIIFMIYAKYFMLFKNDPIKAIGYLDEALDKSLEIYGETHEITAQILKLKGELLWKQKKIDEAIKLFENAESVFEKFKEICFWELADVRSDLGQIWLEKGDIEKGKKYLKDSVLLQKEKYIFTPTF